MVLVFCAVIVFSLLKTDVLRLQVGQECFPTSESNSRGVLFVKSACHCQLWRLFAVRAFVGVWTTAFLSVVFYTSKRNIVVKVHWRFVISVALRLPPPLYCWWF